MDRADAAWRAELAATSVEDLVGMVIASAPRPTLEKGWTWMQEALR
jgi:hypothetical protein